MGRLFPLLSLKHSTIRTFAMLFPLIVLLSSPTNAQQTINPQTAAPKTINQNDTFSVREVVSTGHRFFGSVSGGLASVIERAFSKFGLPNGYILGEQASGAFFGGLQYGEGVLYTKKAGQYKAYWQGPTIGWDFGGAGTRTMMLVYQLPDIDALYKRFPGVSGSAVVVGGIEMSVRKRGAIVVVPIRSGVGARLGVNVGYLKFTTHPTINPF